jgi:hypothetical protein
VPTGFDEHTQVPTNFKELPRGCARGHFTLFLTKVDSLCFQNIKIPERWVENKIPDSVALFTKKTCTIPDLLMMQTKHINKLAIKSLKYFDEVPQNEIISTFKV